MTTEEAIAAAVPACLVVGAIAKAIKGFPDRHIPTACAVAGAVFVGLLTGWKHEAILVGFTAGFGATGVNQMFRQLGGYTSDNNKPQKNQDRET
jgi:hypothetical protein